MIYHILYIPVCSVYIFLYIPIHKKHIVMPIPNVSPGPLSFVEPPGMLKTFKFLQKCRFIRKTKSYKNRHLYIFVYIRVYIYIYTHTSKT